MKATILRLAQGITPTIGPIAHGEFGSGMEVITAASWDDWQYIARGKSVRGGDPRNCLR
jgi:hypothetical protein